MTEVRENGNIVKNWTRRIEDEGQIFGGAFMMWLGISFLLKEMNYIRSNMWWPVFAAGFGVLLILRGLLVYQNGGYWIKAKGHIVGGAFFMLLAFARYVNFHNWWPMILIVIGISTIIGADEY